MIHPKPRRRRAALLTCILTFAAACTGSSDSGPPPPDEAAAAFVASWNDEDAAGMRSLLADPPMWPEARLASFLGDAVPEELDYEVELTGVTEDEGGGEAAYTITYSAADTDGAAALEGTLGLDYVEAASSWKVEWGRNSMWPGFQGRLIEVTKRWPRRAPILDRKGRVLARGPAPARSYPFGATAGSTVGHLGTVTRAEAAESDVYKQGDIAGASGLEAAFDERLAGTAGTRAVVVRNGPREETLFRSDPLPGRPVRTTLDMRVQEAAAAAFGATTGGAVVLDPRAGDILAVVSSAELNPELYVGARDVHPFNRALSGLYPPGSSLKVMTGAAALETDTVNLRTRLTGPAEYKGVRNFESGEFGTIDFPTALKFSVNTAFAQIAEDLGGKRLTRYARLFGFNRPPAMPLGAATSSFPRPEDLGDVMWGSIGQAQVLATPLQMATVAATIANRGRRMEPRISMAVRPAAERVVSRRTASTMTRLMEGVVEGGTGVAARIAGVRVAGKTGTAEVDVNGKRMNHAWFVAFAPADDPQLAVAVVSELGGIGGQVAAPLARGILQATLPLVPR